MILVNLLPEEFIERKITIPLPLKEIARGMLAVLFLIWVVAMFRSNRLGHENKLLQTENQAIAPDLAQSELLIKEMNQELTPKKSFIDRFKKPESQWDQILNLISDSLPDGIWLNSLTLSEEPVLTIRIEGLAKPHKTRSTIGLIGDFITQTKKQLEGFVGQSADNPQGAQGVLPGQAVFDTETFTQQKDLEPIKLTQFMVEFRKK